METQTLSQWSDQCVAEVEIRMVVRNENGVDVFRQSKMERHFLIPTEAEAEKAFYKLNTVGKLGNVIDIKDTMKLFGDVFGYGYLMQVMEEIWKNKSVTAGTPGSEHTVGPCSAFMVRCWHPVKDKNGHCDICCGSNRITQGVAEMLKKSEAKG